MKAEIAIFHTFMAIAESGEAGGDTFKALAQELSILNPKLDDNFKHDNSRKEYAHGTLKHENLIERSYAYSHGIGWVNIWYVPERFQ